MCCCQENPLAETRIALSFSYLLCSVSWNAHNIGIGPKRTVKIGFLVIGQKEVTSEGVSRDSLPAGCGVTGKGWDLAF